MTTHYQLPMFPRLAPSTKWTGGRIADTDTVTLEEAASMASKHAGTEITPADFLRAAARGEILLRAICPRTVTMQPCRESDEPVVLPESGLPTLPFEACKAIANVGRAKWRSCDGFEPSEIFGGALCRFTRWQLPETELDLITTRDDCRVTGYDVHSLADEFKPAPAQDTLTPAPVVRAATDLCAEFREMENLVASELSIVLVGERAESGLGAHNMLEISTRGTTKRVSWAALDLVDRRKGTLNHLGAILLGMAQRIKLMHSSNNAASMKRLRDALRKHLGISGDPFEPYRKESGWVPLFKITDKRGAADMRAKREAELRTDSYEQMNERTHRFADSRQSNRKFDDEHDAADAWLKDHDPEASA